MSTKCSIFLSSDNEHWYFDMANCRFTLEIEKKNIEVIDDNDKYFVFEVVANSPLHQELSKLTSHDWPMKKAEKVVIHELPN